MTGLAGKLAAAWMALAVLGAHAQHPAQEGFDSAAGNLLAVASSTRRRNQEAVAALRFSATALYAGSARRRVSSALYLFKGTDGHWSVFQPPLEHWISVRHRIALAAEDQHRAVLPHLFQPHAGRQFAAFVEHLAVHDQQALGRVLRPNAAADRE